MQVHCSESGLTLQVQEFHLDKHYQHFSAPDRGVIMAMTGTDVAELPGLDPCHPGLAGAVLEKRW